MKNIKVDIIIILIIVILLTILAQLDLLEKSAKFMFVPILGFYYLGKYIAKRYK